MVDFCGDGPTHSFSNKWILNISAISSRIINILYVYYCKHIWAIRNVPTKFSVP